MAGERYDPLPGLAGIPKHVWTHLSPRGKRIMAATLAVVVIGGASLAIALAPEISTSKEERAAEERERAEQARAERIERLEREQRPRAATGVAAPLDAPDEEQLSRRAELLDAVSASVGADARARAERGELRGPIRRVECEPYPRNVEGRGADTDLGERTGRYACLAITTDVKGTELSEGSAIGHPYRVRVDFVSGRYAFCKISGRPGEGSLTREQLVTVPEACGG